MTRQPQSVFPILSSELGLPTSNYGHIPTRAEPAMLSSMEGWSRGETGARVQGRQRGGRLGGAGGRNLRLFLQSHQVYQTLPFAPGRKSKRQAGKAFREQGDHSSLSLEVAGAGSHVRSPQTSLWLLGLQTPVWFCLLVLPSYVCAGYRREALFHLHRLYRNPTAE